MADDILSTLADTYRAATNQSQKIITNGMNDITDGQRLNKDGYLDMRGNWSDDNKKARQAQNELLKAYKEQESTLQNIKQTYADIDKDVRDIAAKNYLFQQKEEENLAKTKLNKYKELYEYSNDKNREYYKKLNEEEANIYKNALDEKRELNKEEIKLLQDIEKRRLQSEENVTKKGLERIAKIKEASHTAVKKIMSFANDITNIMWFDQMKKGMTDFVQVYEQNFTELAGRFGTDRSQTHDLIGSGLSTVNNDATLSGALNFSADVMPAIVEASKAGFMGDEAIEIGINRALDKKIMPWLETNSETWTHLEYNLSDESLRQIKGQQLLLQETREGNRILQNGVVGALMDELAPTLQAIDANTTTKESMGAAYEAVEELMRRGMDKTSAVKFVKDAINADQQTFKALSSNDPAKIAMGMGAMNGGGVKGAIESYSNMFGNMMAGAQGDELAIGAINEMAGGYLVADYDNFATMLSDLNITGKYDNNTESAYNTAVNNANEKVTATQEYDNKIQNEWAENILSALETPHGSDIQVKIFDEVVSIKNWLITTLVADVFSGWIDKGLDKLGGKLFGNVASTGGSTVNGLSNGGGILSSLGGKLGGGLLPGASNVAGAGKLGFMSSGTGALAGTAVGVGAGALMAYHGFSEANKEFSQIGAFGETKDENTAHAVSGTLGATAGVAGAAGAGAILALGASNPIGWAALAIGGVALLGKAAYDNAHALTGNAVAVENSFNNIKDALEQENNARLLAVGNLKQQVDESNSFEENKMAIQQSGLFSDQTIRDLQADSLIELTNKYTEASLAVSSAMESILNQASQENKTEQNEQQDKFLGELEKKFDAQKSAGHGGDKLTAEETDMIGMLMSGVTDEELIKKYETHLESGGGLTYTEAVDIINGGGDNWFDKVNMRDKAVDVSAMQAVDGLYDVTNGSIDWKTFDESKNKEITSLIQQALPLHSTWKDTDDEDVKSAMKNELNDIFQTLHSGDYEDIIKNTQAYKTKLNTIASDIGLRQFKLGSTYIPEDMIALLHAGERVLTTEQNKKYTEDLMTNNSEFKSLSNLISDNFNHDNRDYKENTEDLMTNEINPFKYLTSSSSIFELLGLNSNPLFNKENNNNDDKFTSDLHDSSTSIIQAGVQDIVVAIKTQTTDIINYLSTMSFNNSPFNNSHINMSPTMGNTKISG